MKLHSIEIKLLLKADINYIECFTRVLYSNWNNAPI